MEVEQERLRPEPYLCDDVWQRSAFEVTSRARGVEMMDGWESRCGVWRLIKVPNTEAQYALYLMPIDACLGILATHELASSLMQYAAEVADFSAIGVRQDGYNADGNIMADGLTGISLEDIEDVGAYARYALGAITRMGDPPS